MMTRSPTESIRVIEGSEVFLNSERGSFKSESILAIGYTLKRRYRRKMPKVKSFLHKEDTYRPSFEVHVSCNKMTSSQI